MSHVKDNHGVDRDIESLRDPSNREAYQKRLEVGRKIGLIQEDTPLTKTRFYAYGMGIILSVVALFAGVYYVNSQVHHSAEVDPAVTQLRSTPYIVGDGKSVILRYRPTENDQLFLKNGKTGKVLKTFDVQEGAKFRYQLSNLEEHPTHYVLGRSKDHNKIEFVLPGSQSDASPKGKGTGLEMAYAMANYYSIPIELRLRERGLRSSWEFKSCSPMKSTSTELSNGSFTIQYLTTQVISISQN